LHWRNVHPLFKKNNGPSLISQLCYHNPALIYIIYYLVWLWICQWAKGRGGGGGGVKMKTEMFKWILLWLPPPQKKIYIQYLLMPRTVIRVTRNHWSNSRLDIASLGVKSEAKLYMRKSLPGTTEWNKLL
jgi:hypothetical protein